MRREETSVRIFGYESLFTHLNEYIFSWFNPLFTRIETSRLEMVGQHLSGTKSTNCPPPRRLGLRPSSSIAPGRTFVHYHYLRQLENRHSSLPWKLITNISYSYWVKKAVKWNCPTKKHTHRIVASHHRRALLTPITGGCLLQGGREPAHPQSKEIKGTTENIMQYDRRSLL